MRNMCCSSIPLPRSILLGIGLFMVQWTQAQTDSSEIESFDEVIISAQRQPVSRSSMARQVEILSSKKMAASQPATLADAVQLSGKAFIQKSQLGGGSVVLRGFEASRILLVVDGVRMNNAVYRAGHLQDIVTLDQFSVDRVEMLFGGGSSMYGSDALGGVIYIKTKSPSFTDSLEIKPFAHFRFSSAGNNTAVNAGLTVTHAKSAFIFNATLSEYGDLQMGSTDFSDVPNFGYRYQYAATKNGRDTVIQNNRPRKQIGSGYQQMDYMFKGTFLTRGIKHGFNTNMSLSSGIPRYDRLSNVTNGVPTFAEWEYAPQNRFWISYFAEKQGEKNYQKLVGAFQKTNVSRINRRFNNPTRQITNDKVNMYTLNYDFRHQLSKASQWQTGAELVLNTVNSKGYAENIATLEKQRSNARYADSSVYTAAASVYAGISGHFPKARLRYNSAFRLTAYQLSAGFSQYAQKFLPESTIDFFNFAPSADLGLVYLIRKNWNLKAAAQSAFRNPNVDDATKLFESRPGIKLVVPNNAIEPERTYTAELSSNISKKRFNFEIGAYSTAIRNLMVDQSRGDSLVFQGDTTPVFRIANAASGIIRGAYISAQCQFLNHWYLDASITFTKGRFKADGNSFFEPLDHIPPTFGRLGVKYKKKGFDIQAFVIFNGIKANSEYSSSGEDNLDDTQFGTPNGFTPSWQTYHLSAHSSVSENVDFWIGIDNILDLNYRPFASGINAAGRNLSVTLRYAF
ncbi:MAG: TonB-dependent receptor [Bacteroidia bacterium]|nr:TonB-dependent receptor [Bacteroidia bacterium]